MSSGRVHTQRLRRAAEQTKRPSHDGDAAGRAGARDAPARVHEPSRKGSTPSPFYSPLPRVEADLLPELQKAGLDGLSLAELAHRTGWPGPAIKTALEALARRNAAHFRFRTQAWHAGEDS